MAHVFQCNVFQTNVFQGVCGASTGVAGGGSDTNKPRALEKQARPNAAELDHDLYNKKIKAAIAAEKKKRRLAAAKRNAKAEARAQAEALEQFAEPAQVPAVITDPFDFLNPSIDPNGPIPPIQPMPDVGASMPPQSFLQEQKDQQDVIDIIALLLSPEARPLWASLEVSPA